MERKKSILHKQEDKFSVVFFSIITLVVIMFILLFIVLGYVTINDIHVVGEYNKTKSTEIIDDTIAEANDALELVAYKLSMMLENGADNEEIRDELIEETQRYQSVLGDNYLSFYGNFDGQHISGSGWIPDEDYDPTTRPWYILANESHGELVYTEPYTDAHTKLTIVTISKQLSNARDIVALDLTLNNLNNVISGTLPETKFDFELVMSENGTFISGAGSEEDYTGGVITDELISTAYEAYKEAISGDASTEAEGSGSSDEIELSMGLNNSLTSFASGILRIKIEYKGRAYTGFVNILECGWIDVAFLDTDKESERFMRICIIFIIYLNAIIIISMIAFRVMKKRRERTFKLNNQLQAVATIYDAMMIIDIKNDRFHMIEEDSEEVVERIGELPKTATEILEQAREKVIGLRSREEMEAFMDLDTLDARMSGNTVSIEFINFEDVWFRGRFIELSRDRQGKLVSAIWMVENIDDEKRHRDELKFLSEIDGLTGIYNRRTGMNNISSFIEKGVGGMVIVVDADKFKEINDTFGHDVGDKVLRAVAENLQNSFRINDVVMRLGGDEFAAFAQHVMDETTGMKIIGRFFRNMEYLDIPELNGRPVHVSIGAAFYDPISGISTERLIKLADTCMYKSKKYEENYVTFYDGEDGI